jgi:hypothetical protein
MESWFFLFIEFDSGDNCPLNDKQKLLNACTSDRAKAELFIFFLEFGILCLLISFLPVSEYISAGFLVTREVDRPAYVSGELLSAFFRISVDG